LCFRLSWRIGDGRNPSGDGFVLSRRVLPSQSDTGIDALRLATLPGATTYYLVTPMPVCTILGR
jgi:hypothetical protein